MWINSPEELGQLVREHRKRLGISQAELAARVGATRQWVIALEQGNATAELDRVIRALVALGLRIDVADRASATGTVAAADAVSQEILGHTASGGAGVRRLSTARPPQPRPRTGETRGDEGDAP